jgi:hypothetical protein
MHQYIRSFAAPLALSLAAFVGACGDRSGDNTALTQDSALARDIELANRDTVSEPELSDVPAPEKEAPTPPPARTTPRRTKPAPTTPPPAAEPTPTKTPSRTTTPSGNTVESGRTGSERAVATVPAGTTIALSSGERVCTNTHKAGDRFTATVTEPVTGANGAVIPAGAKAVIVITQLKRSENANEPIQMTFNVTNISWSGKSYPVDATIDHVDVEKVRATSTGSDAKKVIGGAVAGAIIGRIIGKNTRGTVIGAATGAAAGTAVAMGTADYEGCVPTGGKIRIKLNSPATIQAE